MSISRGRVSKSGAVHSGSKNSLPQTLPHKSTHRKIPKISPGAYIFQRPFLRGLFLEGLIYEGKFAFQN